MPQSAKAGDQPGRKHVAAVAAGAVCVVIIYYTKIITRLLLLIFQLQILADGSGPEPVGRRAASFTEAYHYTDGLTVTVTDSPTKRD